MLTAKRISIAACLLLAACANGTATDVLYLAAGQERNPARKQMQAAADFYGLAVDTTTILDSHQGAKVLNAIRDPALLAVIIDADALPSLRAEQFFRIMNARGRYLPVLITGINEQTAPTCLREWSAGQVIGCKRAALEPETGTRVVVAGTDVTKQIGGMTFPLGARDLSYLMLKERAGVQRLITTESGRRAFPVFAAAPVGESRIFFAVAGPDRSTPATPDPYREPTVFAGLAPELIFLRYAGGERAWHSPANYANLTIDDPWLREPYGCVNYERLLAEMDEHNFHTTIAFIPWNFDRSQPSVVSLFRTHSDRYSISMHGDNHDHREFGPYDSRPLPGQVGDVKQGLARMDKFTALTHLSYDPVMVFPHAIAPAETLAVLKDYNFLATANSLNVPLDRAAPSDPAFVLRTVTTAFSNFPSLRRYSAEAPIPEGQLAVDSFLGNPMLFYVHQSFFASGIGGFDRTADLVNRLQPGTQWRSLGYIAKHLYLEKLRSDGNYDVRMHSAVIHLDNHHHGRAEYFIDKKEDFVSPLTVFVDGHVHAYDRSGTWLRLRLEIPDGASREIEIRYKNDFNAAGVDISKKSLRVSAIRQLSDFRDNILSRTRLGRWFIQSYTDDGKLWNEAMEALIALLIALTAFRYVHVRTRWLSKRAQTTSNFHRCD